MVCINAVFCVIMWVGVCVKSVRTVNTGKKMSKKLVKITENGKAGLNILFV